MSGERLRAKISSPGYCPDDRDVPAIFSLLAGDDEEAAKHAARALVRKGTSVLTDALRRFAASGPPERSRLTEFVGRFLARSGDPELFDWLVLRLDDADAKTRRRAATALGNSRGPRAAEALLRAWHRTSDLPELRVLAKALGNAGGSGAVEVLETRRGLDPELDRIVGEARTKLERVEVRREPSRIDAKAVPARSLPLLLHVRAGLEDVLAGELGLRDARVVGRGRVEIALSEPLERLWVARTFLHVGFPLPAGSENDPADALTAALTGAQARDVFSTFTCGPVRYRIEWAGTGRRRSATLRIAGRIRRARPELVNDPVDAIWEAVVTERQVVGAPRYFVELWPNALHDPRFEYRRRVLPASSHPTISAALARIAGVRADDVVWDPFAGAGTELVERALLGPYARLYGSDVDAEALGFARENLRAAGIREARLERADARTFRPAERPTLVITNPPFGRRVLSRRDVEPLLAAVLENIARVLAPRGRVVWVSPFADATAHFAEQHRFAVRLRKPVDLGGPPGEIQMFELRSWS